MRPHQTHTSGDRQPAQSHAAVRFRVLVLGPFALYRDGVQVDVGAWPQHAGTLLRLLAASPEHRRQREEITDLLWPDADAEAGANNLRSVLHRLRRAMEVHDLSPMLLRHGWLELNPACDWDIDLDSFDELSSRGQRLDDVGTLEEAAGLYRGEPLIEDRYQDWATPIRVRIERGWRDLCLRLGHAYQVRGLKERAATWFERAMTSDPLDEAALQHWMLALADCGRRAEAFKAYRQFERCLREELDLAPGAETLAIVEKLEAADPGARPESASAPPSSASPLARDPVAEVDTEPIPVTPTYNLPIRGTFVGRDAEMRFILNMVAQAANADSSCVSPRLVLIAAEAGMGKTRLLAETAARARETGALTLAAGCYEPEGRLPYAPLHDALLDYLRTQPDGLIKAQLGDLMPDLVRIVPEVRSHVLTAEESDGAAATSSGADGQRLRLFAAVAQAFERIAASVPLVLLLDDLHCADDATLQVMHFLLRQPMQARLLVVGVYRQEEVAADSILADIVAGAEQQPDRSVPDEPGETQRIKTVALPPLADADIAALLTARLHGRCSESFLKTVQEWSGGNPLFALEMTRLLLQEARLERSDHGWALRPGSRIDVPRAVREVMGRQVRRLRPETWRALTLGSVLGRAFDPETLAALWDGDTTVLFEALEEAQDASLLLESNGQYVFRHPLLREVVYGSIIAPQRSLLHGRAGLAIEEVSGSARESVRQGPYAPPPDRASELAHHFATAAESPMGHRVPGDRALGVDFRERAIHYSILAGKAAEDVFAHHQAAQHYQAALRLRRRLGDARGEAEMLEKLAHLARSSAQDGEALKLLANAHCIYVEMTDRDGQARVMSQIGWVHYNRGTAEEGLAQLEPALPDLELYTSPPAMATFFVSLSCLYRGRERYTESLAAAERAAHLARAAGDDRLLTIARGRQGMALSMMGREDEALGLFEEVIPRADAAGELDTLERALYNAADVRLKRGEPHKGTEYLERALQVAERLGDPRTMARDLASLAHCAFVMGEWNVAWTYYERASALIGTGYEACALSSAIPLTMAGYLHLAQGQVDEALRCLQQSAALAKHLGDSMAERGAQGALAEYDLVQGRPEAVQIRLEPLLDPPGSEETSVTPLLPLVGFAHLQMGNLDRAEAYARDAVRRAGQPHDRCALVEALRLQAMVLARRERMRESQRVIDRALRLARNTPYPYGEARVLHTSGLITLAARPRKARRQLEDALSIFQRLGAHPYVERARTALGSRIGKNGLTRLA